MTKTTMNLITKISLRLGLGLATYRAKRATSRIIIACFYAADHPCHVKWRRCARHCLL